MYSIGTYHVSPLERREGLSALCLTPSPHRAPHVVNYQLMKFPSITPTLVNRVAQNARGVVKGNVKGVTRASFGRRAPLTPQLKRASARRRKEKVFRGPT